MKLPYQEASNVLKKSAEREVDEKLYQRWLVYLPFYTEDTFKSFKEFRDEVYQGFYSGKVTYQNLTKQQVYDKTEKLFSNVGRLVKKDGI